MWVCASTRCCRWPTGGEVASLPVSQRRPSAMILKACVATLVHHKDDLLSQ